MVRVIHTGDTHLGYQQYHRPERREDFLAAFRQVADDAVDEDVDAVVHAGDLFHDRQPGLDDIMGAMSVLRTLAGADIPFLAVVGNHEGKRDRQWLDLFESLDLATRLDQEPTVVGNTAFYGLDFVPRSRRDALEYDFEPATAEYAALVSHGRFEPFDFGTWDAQEILQESPVAFDALLLGDEHAPERKRLEEPHEAWLTYCGSTERASASERDERGYNLVAFEDVVDIRRRGLETREFVFVDVDLEAGEGTTHVRERISQYDVADAVVIVTVTGDGEEVLPAEVESAAIERGAIVARVNDRREQSEATETEVEFADPDQAVERRLEELGLSPAARDLDETVRASKIADSNVTETVQEHVKSLLEEDDDAVFDPATSPEPVKTDDSTDSREDDKDEAPDTDDENEPGANDSGDAARDQPAGSEPKASQADEDDETVTDQHNRAESTPEETSEASDGQGESQVTMEDYV